MTDVIFEIPCLSEFGMAEIYKLFKENRICKNGFVKPYVFSDRLKKEHSPVIIYEGGDWMPIGNWSIFDKLQFQDKYIRYTNCEMYEGSTVFITGSFLLGSIYSILITINRVLVTINKERKFALSLSIKGNQKTTFRILNNIMKLEQDNLEMYYIEKERKIEHYFNEFGQEEINKFTNKFLGLFVSENKKSGIPFLSAKKSQTSYFHDFLIYNDKYLVIGN